MHPKLEQSIKEGISDIIKSTNLDQQKDRLYEFFINKLADIDKLIALNNIKINNYSETGRISSNKEIKEIVIRITRNNETGLEIAHVVNKDNIQSRDILWWLESIKIEVLETADRDAKEMIIKEQAKS